jgi:hypothetical protein
MLRRSGHSLSSAAQADAGKHEKMRTAGCERGVQEVKDSGCFRRGLGTRN